MTNGSGGFPTVPTDRLDDEDWELAEETVSTVFELPTAEIRDHRVVYEDAALRAAVREATDGVVDQPWRFFFASRLSFLPPLAPGVGPMSVRPSVETESRRAFADELRDRGFQRVERSRRQRLPTEDGQRAALTKYEADLSVALDEQSRTVDVEGWLAVWVRRGSFRVAGGAYPTRGLGPLLGGETVESRDLREELLGLIRRVR
jgi:hypothetical protein